ncbi:Endo-1,4-beta-xylanase A precursor [compost metagenome]
MMVMVGNALHAAGKLSVTRDAGVLAAYSDASNIAPYAAASAANLVDQGIIKGSGGRINPLGYATRAEIAVLIYTVYNM